MLASTGAQAYPVVIPEGVYYNAPGAYQGLAVIPYGPQARLIENDGTIVHTWFPQCGWTYVLRPLANGNLLVKTCLSLVELDWDSNVVWQFDTPPGVDELHHDWDRLPNGNTILLAKNYNSNYPNISPVSVFDDFIYEVEKTSSSAYSCTSLASTLASSCRN